MYCRQYIVAITHKDTKSSEKLPRFFQKNVLTFWVRTKLLIWHETLFSLAGALEDGPGFSMIRVHPRMKIEDTRGCSLPGLATDMDKDFNFAVGRIREALKRIHRILDPFFVEREMDFGG